MGYAVRYAIQLENGDYAREEFHPNIENVKLFSTTDILYASLYENRKMTEENIEKILSGDTSLPVFYDDDNPPVRVVKFKFTYEQLED